jgi:hypothetical protein
MSVDFVSQCTGDFSNVLEFEVVGSEKLFALPCQAKCDVPHMNTDTRNIFMRRAKGRPPPEKVHKKYVLSRNSYEFGPLRVNKPKDTLAQMIQDLEAEEVRREKEEEEKEKEEEKEEEEEEEEEKEKEKKKKDATPTTPTINLGALCAAMDNADVLQISNNGLFDTRVNLAFRDFDQEAADDDDPYPFVIYPTQLYLEPGETKIVTVRRRPVWGGGGGGGGSGGGGSGGSCGSCGSGGSGGSFVVVC